MPSSICRSLIVSCIAVFAYATSYSQAQAEGLQIESTSSSVRLTWPGEELLFSSPNLENFTLIEGAQSPFEQSIEGVDRLFFQLRTLPQVQVPLQGSTIGTELITIQGLIGSALADDDSLTVTVNGQVAQIETNSVGQSIFVLKDFDLAVGLNQLSIVFSTTEGVQQTQNRSVTFNPITANNVVIAGDHAYAAQGAGGVAIVNLETRVRTTLTVGGTAPQVDDVAFDGTFLFTLNTASTNAALSVYSLEDPANPVLVSGPVSAATSFFSGVSAANGRVAVGGGTVALFVRNYNLETGALSAQSVLDFATGHPDVILSADGQLAHVSTDFPGTLGGFSFGISTLSLNNPPAAPTIGAQFGLSGFSGLGLSSGGLTPANFPVESALAGDRLLVTSDNNLAILGANGSDFDQFLPLGFFAVNVDGDETTAFVVGAQNGTTPLVPVLAEINFSDPANPSITSTTSFPGAGLFTSISVNEGFIVIAANAGGLRILNRE